MASVAAARRRQSGRLQSRCKGGRGADAPPISDRTVLMGWILLEAAVALAVGLAIVWWTWPKKPRPGDADDE